MAEALAPMKCWCGPGGCAETYGHEPGADLTFVCARCTCVTPYCCGGDGEGIDKHLCDRCWCERHPDIEAEIVRESREMEAAHG